MLSTATGTPRRNDAAPPMGSLPGFKIFSSWKRIAPMNGPHCVSAGEYL